jgi:hypothetical protein
MNETFALMVVVLTATYFLSLGVLALARPEIVKVFLRAHAGSRSAHFAELAIRILVGIAFLASSARLMLPALFDWFGWTLIATSILLLVLPWHLHRRFAGWSVPQATRNMKLFAAGSLVCGFLLVWSLRLGQNFVP